MSQHDAAIPVRKNVLQFRHCLHASLQGFLCSVCPGCQILRGRRGRHPFIRNIPSIRDTVRLGELVRDSMIVLWVFRWEGNRGHWDDGEASHRWSQPEDVRLERHWFAVAVSRGEFNGCMPGVSVVCRVPAQNRVSRGWKSFSWVRSLPTWFGRVPSLNRFGSRHRIGQRDRWRAIAVSTEG